MPKPSPGQIPLSDTPAGWAADPQKSGLDWICKAYATPSTQRIYGSMWVKFAAWLAVSTRVTVPQCQPRHILAFLNTLESERRPYRIRYVKLLERVYRHLKNDMALCSDNPGTKVLEEITKENSKIAGTKYLPMRFLTQQEYIAVATHVRAVLDAAGKRGREKDREAQESEQAGWINPTDKWEWEDEWVSVRDAAITAMMLEGGLKVSEVVTLAVNLTVTPDFRVTIESGAGRKAHAHDAKLLPLAVYALAVWRQWRKNLGGQFDGRNAPLFPAALGRRTDWRTSKKRNVTPHMHTRTVYHLIHEILGKAGVKGDRTCGQTLRNTYIALCIEEGIADELLMQRVGLRDPLSVTRLRHDYADWKKGH